MHEDAPAGGSKEAACALASDTATSPDARDIRIVSIRNVLRMSMGRRSPPGRVASRDAEIVVFQRHRAIALAGRRGDRVEAGRRRHADGRLADPPVGMTMHSTFGISAITMEL